MVVLNENAGRITAGDIMPMDEYKKIRKEHRRSLIERKLARRVHVGPFVLFHFENYITLWSQIQEMLFIEGGGDEQINDEIEAYNPLLPDGNELVATLLIEIEDADRRKKQLHMLGHIEDKVSININNEKILAVPTDDTERTNSDGKTSSVHFLHFKFNDSQKELFKNKDLVAYISIEHENYSHSAMLTKEVRDSLINDFK